MGGIGEVQAGLGVAEDGRIFRIGCGDDDGPAGRSAETGKMKAAAVAAGGEEEAVAGLRGGDCGTERRGVNDGDIAGDGREREGRGGEKARGGAGETEERGAG